MGLRALLLAQLVNYTVSMASGLPQKVATARLLRHPDQAGATGSWVRIDSPDGIPAELRDLAEQLAARLGMGVADCGWYRSVSNGSRFMCLHLGAAHQTSGKFAAAKLETRPGLLAALQKALGQDILEDNHAAIAAEEHDEGEEEEEESQAEVAGHQGAALPRKARSPIAWWALVLLLALVASWAAPAIPLLPTALVRPFSGTVPALFRLRTAPRTSVTAAWPSELRWLAAQANLDDAVALYNLNETEVLCSQASDVRRAAKTAKVELNTTCEQNLNNICEELQAELTAILAGVQAGQPLLYDVVAADMKRFNHTLDDLAANRATETDKLDSEILLATRVLGALKRHQNLLLDLDTAATESVHTGA